MSCHVYPCFLGHIIEKHMDMISELVQSAPLRLCFPQCVPTASDFCRQSLQHLSPLLPPESGQETEDPLELPTHDDVFRYVGSLFIRAAALPPVQSTEGQEGPRARMENLCCLYPRTQHHVHSSVLGNRECSLLMRQEVEGNALL